MKKRIGFILIIIGIVVGADLLVGAVTGKLIREVPDVGVNQTNTAQALFTRTVDILILGSSRANHSFDCKVIEDSLGMSCYNAGRDGQNMAYDAMVFFSYVKRHKPKMVVLDIASAMMDNSWFGALKDMNCYYGFSQPLDAIIDENTSFTDKIKLLSNLYKYNNTWQWLLKAYTGEDAGYLDGYRPMPVNAKSSFKVIKKEEHFKADDRCIHYLDDIKDHCKKNQIQLILTYTPSLVVATHGGVEEWTHEYAQSNQLPFFSYGQDSTYYMHPELFYDRTHLNAIGAKKFTMDFAHKIKNLEERKKNRI